LELHVRILPNDLKARYLAIEAPIDLIVTVQARGNEVDSCCKRWRIFWDGQWEDGELEMRKHFSVTLVEGNMNLGGAARPLGSQVPQRLRIEEMRTLTSSSSPQSASVTFGSKGPNDGDH